jgi:hypothetical protein
MTKEGRTKIYKTAGRHTIYLPSDVVGDDRFPFRVGEDLAVMIDKHHLLIKRVSELTQLQRKVLRLPPFHNPRAHGA